MNVYVVLIAHSFLLLPPSTTSSCCLPIAPFTEESDCCVVVCYYYDYVLLVLCYNSRAKRIGKALLQNCVFLLISKGDGKLSHICISTNTKVLYLHFTY